MKPARDGYERTKRVGCAQHGDMSGNAGGKSLADQTGAGAGLGKLAGIFQIVEKYQV